MRASRIAVLAVAAGCAHPPSVDAPRRPVAPPGSVLSTRITDPELVVRQHCAPVLRHHLVQATYRLDGAVVFQRVFDQTRPPGSGFAVLEGRVAPGRHELAVALEFQGNRSGLLSSTSDDYRITVAGERSFVLGEGQWLEITVRGEEPLDPAPEAERPVIAFDVGYRSTRN